MTTTAAIIAAGEVRTRTRTWPGLIRYSLALAILPPLFWFAPDIMRTIGGLLP